MVKVFESTVLNAPVEEVWEIIRDFNGHDYWHPLIKESKIEKRLPSDKVGCIRNFILAEGGILREQLLTLSDVEMAFSYCLLDTPIPLFNYISHVRLLPITDGDKTFWNWESSFDTPDGQENELKKMVGDEVYKRGFQSIKEILNIKISKGFSC